MSKYTDIIHSSFIVCPYCKFHDDPIVYQIGLQHEIECQACATSFYLIAGDSYHTSPDCHLNDIEHDWREVEKRNVSYAYCETCDKVFNEAVD